MERLQTLIRSGWSSKRIALTARYDGFIETCSSIDERRSDELARPPAARNRRRRAPERPHLVAVGAAKRRLL